MSGFASACSLAFLSLSAVVTAQHPGTHLKVHDFSPESCSVTLQANAAHDGNVSDSLLVPPLTLKWSLTFAPQQAGLSYPLVVGDRIYITAGDNVTAHGYYLHAISAQSGLILWSQFIPLSYLIQSNVPLAYDNEKVFVGNVDGTLWAFDAPTGNLLWHLQLPAQYGLGSAPTAYKGVLYVSLVGGGGNLYAINEDTGMIVWSHPVFDGYGSSPMVTDHSVYAVYTIQHGYSIDRATGSTNWDVSLYYSPASNKACAFHGGRLFCRDTTFNGPTHGVVIDPMNGAQIRTFDSSRIPAFDKDRGYFLRAGTLVCEDITTGQSQWAFSGNPQLTTAPLVVGGYVYIGGSDGSLYAFDAHSGAVSWTTNVGTGLFGNEQSGVIGYYGLGAGLEVLAVPSPTALFAFGN